MLVLAITKSACQKHNNINPPYNNININETAAPEPELAPTLIEIKADIILSPERLYRIQTEVVCVFVCSFGLWIHEVISLASDLYLAIQKDRHIEVAHNVLDREKTKQQRRKNGNFGLLKKIGLEQNRFSGWIMLVSDILVVWQSQGIQFQNYFFLSYFPVELSKNPWNKVSLFEQEHWY